VLILSAADVRRALPMAAAIESQRRAFAALSTGEADLPLRTALRVEAEEAVSLFMPARVGGDLGAKVVSVFPRNPARGLPTVHGMVVLIDGKTGGPAALMEAGSLTALRTGAASGLATDLLANPDTRTAAILGTGAQAATQLLAVCTVRSLRRVYVYSRDLAHIATFIARHQDQVPTPLVACASAAEAVRQADIVCAATTSATPVLDGRDLRPGAHVNGVGSYTTQMQEVDAETVRRAGRVFVDSRQAALAEAGDVVIPLAQGILRELDLVELGAVVAGSQPGRTGPEAVTFFKSVGVAVQDVTAAGEVLRRAREIGLGTEVAL
jgi:ornithine cyclodeaminase/alanine dehydrogenase-like protein (mu-crystallin family)